MVQIRVLIGGMREALSAVALIGEAGKAVNGPLATFTSTLPYARSIEEGRRRRAGPANMFRDGVKVAADAAPGILGPAIPKGPAAIGQAKAKIRTLGVEEIRKRTPVRTGKLRASVSVSERPGIGGQ